LFQKKAKIKLWGEEERCQSTGVLVAKKEHKKNAWGGGET